MSEKRKFAGDDDEGDFAAEDFPEDFVDEEDGEIFPDEDEATANKRLKTEQILLSEESSQTPQSHRWRRPPLPFLDLSSPLSIQNVEADYGLAQPTAIAPFTRPYELPGQKSAVLRIFGVTTSGNSVLFHVHNFFPYFFIPTWQGFSQGDLNLLGESLNNELKEQTRGDKTLDRHVLSVEPVKRQSIWGFHFGQKHDFLKVVVAVPALVATSRRILERGIICGRLGHKQFVTYESNLPYVLRGMVDKDIRGGGWLSVAGGAYKVRADREKISRCQLEIDCDYRALTAHESVGEWLKMAPLRVLSFDIECAGRKGHFPKPEIDPVIQIACCLALQSNLENPIVKVVFTLNTCAPIVGAQVISSATEEDLLMNFLRFFLTCDPDLLTGYNIINFDLPYLLDRAKTLKCNNFPYFGRLIGSPTTMKNSRFESRALGIRENKEIKIEGRVQFDLIDVIRREYKLRSYTLNAVCQFFLNQQKEDVHHSIISDLQNGSDETRKRLATYCLKDALLPLLLMQKLMLLINYIEMARVTGVPLSYLLTRGQQIKVISQLYRKARQYDLLIPVRQIKKEEEKYEGATVIEPKKGFYALPIATLDFASLYPSIMQAHNLCYSSLLAPRDVGRLKPEDFVKTPTGDLFVKPHVHKGLLPEILTELLVARSNAKKEMAKATDPLTKAVLNGRQLALKISANSVYGFTGAQVGQLPCLAISSSVTGFGRDMIMHTKKKVEEQYTTENGYQFNAEVIYGDTDSVMVKFGVSSVGEAMRLGAEAAALVTKEFLSPIKLEFEKVYFPYLLMNKKRYAGLYWTRPEKHDKMDTKGIETVRRDTCALVANVVSECLNKILIDRDVNGALSFTKGIIADLLTNRLDLSLLVITKSLGKGTDGQGYVAKQAHVELAERMRKRDPRSAPVVGDRVAYVITKAAKGAPAYEKAEDPIYVLEHDIPIDTEYYLKNQLMLPLTRIFEPILGNTQDLFQGDHTRHIKISTPSTAGGIMAFAVKKRTCLGCKVPLKDNEASVCSHCIYKQADLYVKAMEKVREFEEVYGRAWTQCQRCSGTLHQDVLCTSRDCPIFYRRKKVQKDLKEAQEQLDRFSF